MSTICALMIARSVARALGSFRSLGARSGYCFQKARTAASGLVLRKTVALAVARPTFARTSEFLAREDWVANRLKLYWSISSGGTGSTRTAYPAIRWRATPPVKLTTASTLLFFHASKDG